MSDIQLSIVIKALNEEDNIAKCIEYCIKESASYNCEIILVDSLSTDKTVEIAKQYPIRIIQFSFKEDIGCGSAPQLGYQYANGKYIYLIDGDMVLCPGFLDRAIQHLKGNADCAGVAGRLVDTQFFSSEDKRRSVLYSDIKVPKNVSHLGGGGIYRKEAIKSVGYFSHSGLLAFEEFELGSRLTAKGWLLTRLAVDASFHKGHAENNVSRIKRLWRNGRLAATGTLLKSAMGKPWFFKCVTHLWYIFVPLIINLFIVIGLLFISCCINLTLPNIVIGFSSIWLMVLLFWSMKKKSIAEATNSIITWHIGSLAFIFSLFKKHSQPNEKINGNIIK